MRLQDRPVHRAGCALLFADFHAAAEAVRASGQAGLYPSNLRLLDAAETRNTGAGDGTSALMVHVVWKDLEVKQGQRKLFDDSLGFFYITNDRQSSAEEIVFKANARCNQENTVIEQLKNGVLSLTAPLDNLVSNWAYMVISSLAWSLKAWAALLLPEQGRWKERYKQEKQRLLRMEFSTFRQAWINMPAQIVRTGRRIIYRLLSWNRWQPAFFRLLDALQSPLRC